ncbi:MAG: GAF domain-containing protein [Candidatus Zixiibacteriota bacterium]
MAQELFTEVDQLTARKLNRDDFLLEIAKLIQAHYPQYNWVGFYFLEDDGRLHVGPYVGKPTPHTVIDLNKGICGAAVSQQETIIVDDVNADPRYLACSLETRSEIVIPLKVNGDIIGELDIDSSQIAAFRQEDRVVLEKIVEKVGRALEE